MPPGRGTVSLPFGPSNSSISSIWTLTPFGNEIGFFPTLDMTCYLSVWSKEPCGRLPDLTKNLPSQAFLVRLAAGHHAAWGRQYVDAQAAEDPRNLLAAHVHPAAGAGHSLN